jgi:hypothetical protein
MFPKIKDAVGRLDTTPEVMDVPHYLEVQIPMEIMPGEIGFLNREKLSVSEYNPESSPRIFPSDDTFILAHYPTSTAFQATGVIKVDFTVL